MVLLPARGREFGGAGWDPGAVSGPRDPSVRVWEAVAASQGGNEQQRDGASEELPKEVGGVSDEAVLLRGKERIPAFSGFEPGSAAHLPVLWQL